MGLPVKEIRPAPVDETASRSYGGRVTAGAMDLVYSHILLVNDLNGLLNRHEELDEIVKLASDRLKEIHGFKGVVVMMKETADDGSESLVVYHNNLDSRLMRLVEVLTGVKSVKLKAPIYPESIYVRLYAEGKPHQASGEEMAQFFRDLVLPGHPARLFAKQVVGILNIKSVFSVPVLDGGVAFGHIGCFSDEELPEEVKVPVALVCDKIGEVFSRYRNERTLLEHERKYALLFDEMINAFALHRIVLDKSGKAADYVFLEVNRAFEEMTGLKREDIIGKRAKKVLPTLDKTWLERYGRIATGGKPERFQQYSAEMDQYFDIAAYSPEPGFFATIFSDISYQKRLERDLKINEERLGLALYAARLGLFDIDLRTGDAVVSNEYAAMLGFDPALFAETKESWFSRIHPDDRANVERLFQRYIDGEILEFKAEYRMLTSVKSWLWVLSTGGAVEWTEKAVPMRFVGTMFNIADRKKMEEELLEAKKRLEEAYTDAENRSRTDGLTGISNRRYFNELTEIEWRRGLRGKYPISVLMIDIDHFKKYNDSLGHPEGDRCLRLVAETIRSAVRRPPDIVARYGGEEFIVLLPDTDSIGAAVVAEAIRAEVESLAIPHPKSKAAKVVTISVGYATAFPGPGVDSGHLVQAADRALYRAKKEGRNRSAGPSPE